MPPDALATAAPFLADQEARRVTITPHGGLSLRGLFLGQGNPGLEILLCDAPTAPAADALRLTWRDRQGRRAAPLLLVVLHGSRATLCGPSGEDPPLRRDKDPGQIERLCRLALAQPDRHAALRFLTDALDTIDDDLPGIRNEGLFSHHELATGAQRHVDWTEAATSARRVIGQQGEALLRALGFTIQRLDAVTAVLAAGDRQRAAAVLLHQHETPEAAAERFQGASPVSWALAQADARNLPWVVVVQGDRIRLYATGIGVGVGRRGRTETWIELQTALMRDVDAGLLWLILSAPALLPGGSLERLLDSSRDHAGDLARRLRERIYRDVVPLLARGIVAARALTAPDEAALRLTYEMALTVLFRLLFIAYAEDRDLLPYRSMEAYRHRALKTKAREFAERPIPPPPAPGAALWHEARDLFAAIASGSPRLGLPAYDGGLFSEDPAISAAGAALATIELPDSVFEPALRALLLIEGQDGIIGPVDFRALGVREFGTIYEGLLESELALADQDLTLRTVRREPVYVPARGRDPIEVPKGDIYLHNRSGARKASGSYFTPDFVVDHLLDQALEPALTEHLARLAALDETDAAEAFFDLRVADIAMGSGHFLVAAVDRIERRLSSALTDRPLPGVRRELATLRAAAEAELQKHGLVAQIEDMQLLRRLVARRCLYGVDLNPLAVQLARLSIWIHTFVPGLPLSLLDRTLVQGNALVGIATIDQLRERFDQAGTPMFPVDADNLLGDARAPLARLARLADATMRDIAAGREAMEQARLAVGPTRALCDLVVAEKIAPRLITFQFERWTEERARIQANPVLAQARQALGGAFHFPVAFPEVFLRRRPGFDVILGNPPWQELTVEEHAFWARHFPGLRGLEQREQEAEKARLRRARPDLVARFEAEKAETERERAVLTCGFYPGMGTGDPDLYKAFAWRFWDLASADRGRIGVVLPRNALTAAGSAQFRCMLLSSSHSVSTTVLKNRGGWVFPDYHHQEPVALLAIGRAATGAATVTLRGPFSSRAELEVGMTQVPPTMRGDEVLSWTPSASLPLLPDGSSFEIFAAMRRAPRLDLNDGTGWRARPDRELDATNDKPLMIFAAAAPPGFWPVYKGESFDLWQPDTGTYYAWAEPKAVQRRLQEKRLRSARSRGGSAHSEFPAEVLRDPKSLSCFQARVVFRDVTNRTNKRTIVCALAPPKVFLTNKAPYILWPRGAADDAAFLLAMLTSVPLDWYARRFVSLSVNFFIFNPFPIPRPPRNDPRRLRAIALAGRLAAPDDRFTAWSHSVGVAHGPLRPDEKQDMIEELDAVAAHLYGLTEPQLTHIFATFHEGWDYEDQLRRTLRHFHRLGAHA